MDTFDFETLEPLGFAPALLARSHDFTTTRPGSSLARIVEVERDQFTVLDGHGERPARALRRLIENLRAQDDALTIGDWVGVRHDPPGVLWIAERVPPHTQIARRANDGRRQPLASNVDTALLVMGLDADFNARRMERYLAMVRACKLAPVVVLTKRDIAPLARERIAEMSRRLPATVPVLGIDARSPQAATELDPWLAPGQTLVLLGSSGAGKSTLTNTLAGAAQRTGEARRSDGRGRHTTTARSLHACPQGSWIIDTPGLRTWRPDIDAQALAATFEDVQALGRQCRFRNCHHAGEPGCAVREAIDADRLENYRKLMHDAQREEMTPLDKIALRRKWKAIAKAGNQRARDKRL